MVVSSHRIRPGVQEKLFGARGVTSLTVDPTDLGKQSSKSYSSPTGISVTGRPMSASARHGSDAPKPSRWKTPEFFVYWVVFLISVPYMAWVPIRLSQYDHPNFTSYSSHLQQGWLFGRLRDNSDFQYRGFRDYFPMLACVLLIYAAISHLIERASKGSGEQIRGAYTQVGSGGMGSPSARIARRIFLVVFTAGFVSALHGSNTPKLLACCAINYVLIKAFGGTVFATPVIWTFNIVVLYLVHFYDGFDLTVLSSLFGPLEHSWKGLLPRWQINYNITMLRLVSFGLDYHWAKQEQQSSRPTSAAAASKEVDPYRERCSRAHALPEYNAFNYFLYALYPPLFIAGPIMTFNDFHAQLKRPVQIQARLLVNYAIRFASCILTMELILHFMYVNAIKESKAWNGDSPAELSLIGFWNLIIVWLKVSLFHLRLEGTETDGSSGSF